MIPQFPNESSDEVIEYTAESDAAMLRSADAYLVAQRKAKQAAQENKTDPMLEKLVTGAQQHVKDPGYRNALAQKHIESIRKYEQLKAEVFAKRKNPPKDE